MAIPVDQTAAALNACRTELRSAASSRPDQRRADVAGRPVNMAYRLTMAVAGFSPSEIDVTVQENTLLVTGKAQKEEERKNGNGYLHRGIARRAFERRFSLADHMKVTGANLDNGMLHVEVVH
jgi:HSP20 family molecular chaperone IbpA